MWNVANASSCSFTIAFMSSKLFLSFWSCFSFNFFSSSIFFFSSSNFFCFSSSIFFFSFSSSVSFGFTRDSEFWLLSVFSFLSDLSSLSLIE
ncbi:hypothetical protein FCM78_03515, partial [Mycoplasma bovis]|nr:hypothetical protein [Mycoplasmopsis bovis]MBT1396208.1 hypothetical protein [Mycoplasmopsis bovis]